MEASHFSCDLQGHSHSPSHGTVQLGNGFWVCWVSTGGGRELIGDGSVWQWSVAASVPEWEVPAHRKKHVSGEPPGV